jgi:hypothetical protein
MNFFWGEREVRFFNSVLEPRLQSILLWLFWRWGLRNYLLAWGLDPHDLSLPSARITGVSHQHPSGVLIFVTQAGLEPPASGRREFFKAPEMFAQCFQRGLLLCKQISKVSLPTFPKPSAGFLFDFFSLIVWIFANLYQTSVSHFCFETHPSRAKSLRNHQVHH